MPVDTVIRLLIEQVAQGKHCPPSTANVIRDCLVQYPPPAVSAEAENEEPSGQPSGRAFRGLAPRAKPQNQPTVTLGRLLTQYF